MNAEDDDVVYWMPAVWNTNPPRKSAPASTPSRHSVDEAGRRRAKGHRTAAPIRKRAARKGMTDGVLGRVLHHQERRPPEEGGEDEGQRRPSSRLAGLAHRPVRMPSSSAMASAGSSTRMPTSPARRAPSTLPGWSSRNTARAGFDRAEELERVQVDAGIGLAHPDRRRVDHRVEQLVDVVVEHRAPALRALADVVGDERDPVARRRAASGCGRPRRRAPRAARRRT